MSITDKTQLAEGSDIRTGSQFPPGFLWGTATSAYQIEGAAHEGGRGLSIWDTFAATPGKTFNGESGLIATDHYHRMEQDVDLMAAMGIGSYRFSISWPRVLPTGTGAVNTQGLDFYDRLVDTLLSRGITPLATLYHWDLPFALHERGGWLSRDTAYAFAEYAEVVARRLGDRVNWWITHNEPWCAAYLGYGVGVHAPGMTDVQSSVTVAHHLLLSHGLAVARIRALANPRTQVGITLNFSPIYAADERPETQRIVNQLDAFHNRWFLDPIYRGSYPRELFEYLNVAPPVVQNDDFATIMTPIDFLGVNYYSRTLTRAKENGTPEFIKPVPGSIYTEMGWEVYPRGLADLLRRIHRDYAPNALIVTENGAAFSDQWDGDGHVHDSQRVHYLDQHIQALEHAVADGLPLSGYFVWSLLDNFEWAEGYSKRFGLVYVDYATRQRIVKDSGRWYAEFLAAQKR